MRIRLYTALSLALFVALSACSSKPKPEPLNSVMLSALAEPAVFKVVELGEYQMHDVRFVANRTTLPPITSSADCWIKIANSPNDYLSIALRSDRLLSVRKVFATGSSVAVAHNGVFLTNAHVVGQPDDRRIEELLPATMGVADSLISALHAPEPTLLQQVMNLAPLGCRSEPANADVRQYVQTKLAVWMIEQGVLTSARLATVYVVTQPKMARTPQLPRFNFPGLGLTPHYGSRTMELLHTRVIPSMSLVDVRDPTDLNVSVPGPSDTPSSYATEVEVLSQGEIFPGEDVAVLRSKQPLSVICLPLGGSDRTDLPDGSEIAAFGFPGAAELTGLSKDDAHPKVIRHDGKVAQRVTTAKSWEALYTNAEVSEGDSGGPVIDRFGRVVGLNDYGSTARAGNNVSVPVDLAKKYLEKAHVKADPGSLTDHWIKGQEFYSRGEYAKALREFEIVNGTREDPDAARSKPMFQRIASLWKKEPPRSRMGFGNEYVEQAIFNCQRFLPKRSPLEQY